MASTHKIDFEDKHYNDLYNYICEKYNKRCISASLDKYCIEINDGYVSYSIQFSGNERKMYFIPVPYDIRIIAPYELCKQYASFRVFRIDEAIQYVNFKLKETELIKSIQG
ncbi:MAG TPA: hypothetical protein VIK09_05020 [Candidatus Humimicrobiaceae bacterium]